MFHSDRPTADVAGVADMQVDLIIFGCEGVLLDSEGLRAGILIDAFAEIGVKLRPSDVAIEAPGRDTAAAVLRLALRRNVVPPAGMADLCVARMAERLAEVGVVPGACRMIEGLAVPFCGVSDGDPDLLAPMLDRTGLSKVLGGRVVNACQVDRRPPAPDLVLRAAANFGASPGRTLVVDDSGPGLVGALSAGMQARLFAGGTHHQGADLSAWRGIGVMHSWDDLPCALLRSGQRSV